MFGVGPFWEKYRKEAYLKNEYPKHKNIDEVLYFKNDSLLNFKKI